MLASSVNILVLDACGTPRRWLDLEDTAGYYCKQQVAWDLGEHSFTLHGGINRVSGLRSTLTLRSIVAVRGERARHAPTSLSPSVGRPMLFARDRCMCAYCGVVFRSTELTAEHVRPQSRGGGTTWTNLVSACRACNVRKGDRTPEQARMPLLYVPYAPNIHEAFILRNRRILGDQMDFLMAGVPAHSRLRNPAPV